MNHDSEKKKSLGLQSAHPQTAIRLREKEAEIAREWRARMKERLPSDQNQLALAHSLPLIMAQTAELIASGKDYLGRVPEDRLLRVSQFSDQFNVTQFPLDQVLLEFQILREVIYETLENDEGLPSQVRMAVEESIQTGMGEVAAEFFRVRIIQEKAAQDEVKRANQRLKDLQLITEIALERSRDLERLFNEVLREVRRIFSADTVAILLADPEYRDLVLTAFDGLDRENEIGMRVPWHEGMAGRIFSAGRVVQFEDLKDLHLFSPRLREHKVKSILGGPLRASDRIVGVLHVGTLEKRRFTESEFQLLQIIGDRIGIAVENAQLYEKSRIDIANLVLERNIRNRFISILTHDIRNPLTAAKMSSELLKRQYSKPEAVRVLGSRIVTALGHSDELIQDLLDINKILAHQDLPLEVSTHDLRELLVHLISRLTQNYGERFELDCPPSVQGYFSAQQLIRMIELATRAGIIYGSPQTPVHLVVSIPRQGRVQISIRFEGQLGIPHGDPLEESKHASRWGLEWALIQGFAQAHEGTATLTTEQNRTQILLDISCDLREESVRFAEPAGTRVNIKAA